MPPRRQGLDDRDSLKGTDVVADLADVTLALSSAASIWRPLPIADGSSGAMPLPCEADGGVRAYGVGLGGIG